MKVGFITLAALVVTCLTLSMEVYCQTGNVGIGTTTPTTKLDVNGAITNREAATAIVATSGTAAITQLTNSQFRLTGTPAAAFTITGPTTSNGSLALVAGARMVLINATTQIGILNGASIQPGTAQEFAYTNGAWVATNGGARPDYDWMKADNSFPTAPADTVNSIYHLGNTAIGRRSTLYALHVEATADVSNAIVNNLVAEFTPFGGSDPTRAASIAVNGRAMFGYDLADGTANKYAFIRGNQAADIRLQVVDQNAVLHRKAFVMSGADVGFGFIGINNNNPQSQLDIRGTTKILGDTNTQTGTIWNGTSNMSGFEVTANHTTGDVFLGIQRSGPFAPLLLSKPAGTAATSHFIDFVAGGSGVVASVTYTGSGVLYNTSSDERLKENVRNTRFGLATIKGLQVYDYTFTTDPQKSLSTGVMAQDLYNVYPQAVSKGGDNPKMNPWQVDYSKLTPLLIKAVQELNSKLEILEKENAELKSHQAAVAQLAAEMKELKQLLGVKATSKGIEIAKK